MPQSSNKGFLRQIYRRPHLPGMELLEVHEPTGWRSYSTGTTLLIPTTWSGDILHCQRLDRLEPGMVFIAEPGLLYTVTNGSSGSVDVLAIDAENPAGEGGVPFGPGGKEPLGITLPLAIERQEDLASVCREFKAPSERHDAWPCALRVLRTLACEGRTFSRPEDKSERTAQLARDIRARLELRRPERVDLQSLAHAMGISPFQTLRAFRRYYGLPPGQYQLHLRIAMAQRALRKGSAAAQVAVDFSFVDQAHFARHFKRIVGVTPGQYVRAKPKR